ncbi:MAG: tyrosine-type recombinase/integrase [Rhodobacterales bacterium]
MSYGVNSIQVHKKLRLDKRKGSTNWYARITLPNGKRDVKSTGTDEVEAAKEIALKLYYETQARLTNNLPASTRKFKHVADFAAKRMQDELDAGTGKVAYKDYLSALKRYLIPYFEKTDVVKIDLAALKAFDDWRIKEMGKKPAQSTINNHNAALNRVLDEAELHGWITKTMRPTLLNKGLKTESRGSFTLDEYKVIYTALRDYHTKTTVKKAAATRETLRNYFLFLANTGIRHGTEALNLRWKNIQWHTKGDEKYLVVNVDGKTKKRPAIARDRTENLLLRQSQLNPKITVKDFDDLIQLKSDEFVFTTRLGQRATIHNLNAHFNQLLDELKLKTGADGKARTLYSLRHFYATQDLERGMSTHALSKQMGNSSDTLDKYYSKYSPLINAELHSGRNVQKKTITPKPPSSTAQFAFDMLSAGKLTQEQLLAAVGVSREGYTVTEEVAMLALQAKNADQIDGDTLLKILNG